MQEYAMLTQEAGSEETRAPMELKRSGYGVKLALAVLLAVFLAGYATLAVIYLIVRGDRKVLFGAVGVFGLLFLAFVLLELLFVCAFGWIFFISYEARSDLDSAGPRRSIYSAHSARSNQCVARWPITLSGLSLH